MHGKGVIELQFLRSSNAVHVSDQRKRTSQKRATGAIARAASTAKGASAPDGQSVASSILPASLSLDPPRGLLRQ